MVLSVVIVKFGAVATKALGAKATKLWKQSCGNKGVGFYS